jgi:hypothetical protein
MLVLILLLATRLLHFKKQIFNYYGAFWFSDDYVKWFCSYVTKCQTFIDNVFLILLLTFYVSFWSPSRICP